MPEGSDRKRLAMPLASVWQQLFHWKCQHHDNTAFDGLTAIRLSHNDTDASVNCRSPTSKRSNNTHRPLIHFTSGNYKTSLAEIFSADDGKQVSHHMLVFVLQYNSWQSNLVI